MRSTPSEVSSTRRREHERAPRIARPGDLGFDCIHINVHKTFSTPHGAGGSGCGSSLREGALRAFLPKPWIVRDEQGRFHLDTAATPASPPSRRLDRPVGIPWNFGVLVRAYTIHADARRGRARGA